ncbi:MAG: SIMPL domain-containing protein [Candidatus Paceibacterota bacterium]
MQTFMEKYQTVIIRLVIIIGVLLGLFLLVATLVQVKSYKYVGSGMSASNVITVNGHGEVEKAPDTAKFSFTIQNEASDTATAQDVVSKKTDQVKKDLIAAGIEEKYITTDSYNSYPDYQYNNIKCTTAVCPSSQTLKGYIVSQNVKVTVKDLTKAEPVAGILGKDGVTSIDGPNFGFEDSHVVSNEARDAAIADAKVQAEKLADALGVHIVRIVSFNENGGGNPVSPMAYGMKSAMMDSVASAPSLPTGVQNVTSDVSITYEIR